MAAAFCSGNGASARGAPGGRCLLPLTLRGLMEAVMAWPDAKRIGRRWHAAPLAGAKHTPKPSPLIRSATPQKRAVAQPLALPFRPAGPADRHERGHDRRAGAPHGPVRRRSLCFSLSSFLRSHSARTVPAERCRRPPSSRHAAPPAAQRRGPAGASSGGTTTSRRPWSATQSCDAPTRPRTPPASARRSAPPFQPPPQPPPDRQPTNRQPTAPATRRRRGRW